MKINFINRWYSRAFISFLVISLQSFQIKVNTAEQIVYKQANSMGQAFLNRDIKGYVKYIYPPIVNAMGGEQSVKSALQDRFTGMQMQGMYFDHISFDHLSKIIKSNTEYQCTLNQHIIIKVANGKTIITSTLIAISGDSGKTFTFIDTSNKDIAAIRKAIPTLSPSITIAAPEKPIFVRN
jgi:hypothetical protein